MPLRDSTTQRHKRAYAAYLLLYEVAHRVGYEASFTREHNHSI